MLKRGMFSVSLCWEAILLFAICAADLLSTSIILALGGGESNPIMKVVLEGGGIASVTWIKLSWLFLTILLMESARTGNISFRKEIVPPSRIKRYYRACIAAYILLYVGCVVAVNL